jgi:hypothetical protein
MSEKSSEPRQRRGEAAWKEEREQVAGRNAKARKAGMEQRATHEHERAVARVAREQREMAAMAGKRGGLARKAQ